MSTETDWDSVKQRLKVGDIVDCTVFRCVSFGIFVKIPDIPFLGLIEVLDFSDESSLDKSNCPSIGARLKAVILGFKDNGQQIWLGVKPSQLRTAEQAHHTTEKLG